MFGLEALDVMIGLVTVYLVFGLACTAIVEAIATLLKVRSTNLHAAMSEFLAGDLNDTENFVEAFYSHPLVQSLSKGDKGRPSYIPSETVALVVEELVRAGKTGASIMAAVEALPQTPDGEPINRIRALLQVLAKQAGDDAAKFRTMVETHFNVAMDRVSGWVKRRQQWTAIVTASILVLGANVDTIAIAQALTSKPEARATVRKLAEEILIEQPSEEARATDQQAEKKEATATEQQPEKKIDTTKTNEALDRLREAKKVLETSGLPFGWEGGVFSLREWIQVPSKILGWLISIFAISLGAPFWFDVLQRFMKVRAAGSVEAKDEKKK